MSLSIVSSFLVWHSQITKTSQPSFRNSNALRSSRSLFASSLGNQKSSRDFGKRASLQSGSVCRCQKHP